jgi:hypothetical protein
MEAMADNTISSSRIATIRRPFQLFDAIVPVAATAIPWCGFLCGFMALRDPIGFLRFEQADRMNSLPNDALHVRD